MEYIKIINVCARPQGHPAQHERLRTLCLSFTDWNNLLEEAELHGMSPLLRKHCLESGSNVPKQVLMSLELLCKQHKKNAAIRTEVLGDLLRHFRQHGLKPVLIKGAALCHLIYQEPGLRPMRDMDLLFAENEIAEAQKMLLDCGFIVSKAPLAPDHYHQPSLHKMIEGMVVCLELHSGLYPDCPPGYPPVIFNQLYERGRTMSIDGEQARTFSHEDMLCHIYQHGLRAPLTYESYKLINIADIVGYAEKYMDEIDWQEIQKRYPGLYRSLPLMEQVTPWDREKVSELFQLKKYRELQTEPQPFIGWPRRRIKELEHKVLLKKILKDTFLPPRWWLGVYYGTGLSWLRYVGALVIQHPKNVLWWVHVYSHFVIQTKPHEVNPDNTFWGSVRLFFISNWNKIKSVIFKIQQVKRGP